MAKKVKPKLNQRQLMFVKEYLLDFNGTRSAKAAGYSEKSAAQASSDLLINPKVRDEINARVEERNKICHVDQQYVVNRLKEVTTANFYKYAQLGKNGASKAEMDEMPESLQTMISSIEVKHNVVTGDTTYKYKLMDKTKCLEMLAKHTRTLVDVVEQKNSVDEGTLTAVAEHLDKLLK